MPSDPGTALKTLAKIAAPVASPVAALVLLASAAAGLSPEDAARVDRVAGVPVVADTLMPEAGYTDGQTIFLRPDIYGRLSLGSVRYGCCAAWPIFVLTHELGHVRGPPGPLATYEDRANDWASIHFCELARRLGASPRRVQRLKSRLPGNWTDCDEPGGGVHTSAARSAMISATSSGSARSARRSASFSPVATFQRPTRAM